jgi:demethylphylloquinone reductase
MTDTPTRICIVGGGFGGLYTALRLNELPWESNQKPEIILIDKGDRFLFSPLLYELISGEMQSWEVAPPFTELLAETSVKFVKATVASIDIPNQYLTLENNSTLNFDRLVIATGGKTPMDMVAGAKEYAIPFRTLNDAYRLEERLKELERNNHEKIRVAVAGGGYSGIEIACKVADRLGERGRVRIIEKSDDILRNSPEFNRNTSKKALESRHIWLDLETEITEITASTISLNYKEQIDTIPVDLVLWTVGNQVSELITRLSLKQNNRGLLTIDRFLRVEDNPDIYAIGDVADCTDANGEKVAATAQVAFQQADFCAWNIWASIINRPPLPFRYQPLGEMLALGVDNATLSGLGMNLDGSFAYLARRLIYLYRLPTWKHQLAVGLNWFAKPFLP